MKNEKIIEQFKNDFNLLVSLLEKNKEDGFTKIKDMIHQYSDPIDESNTFYAQDLLTQSMLLIYLKDNKIINPNVIDYDLPYLLYIYAKELEKRGLISEASEAVEKACEIELFNYDYIQYYYELNVIKNQLDDNMNILNRLFIASANEKQLANYYILLANEVRKSGNIKHSLGLYQYSQSFYYIDESSEYQKEIWLDNSNNYDKPLSDEQLEELLLSGEFAPEANYYAISGYYTASYVLQLENSYKAAHNVLTSLKKVLANKASLKQWDEAMSELQSEAASHGVDLSSEIKKS
ncbi:MAG: hypothetical protein RR945_10590 [Erysipelotrichaceae bacterium]